MTQLSQLHLVTACVLLLDNDITEAKSVISITKDDENQVATNDLTKSLGNENFPLVDIH